MSEMLSILPEVIAALTAGGWLMSRFRRRREREEHAAEIAAKEAEITSKLRESETKYTREALEIYTKQVVEPLRQQLDRNTEAIARYQGAIDMAPTCRTYPDCVVVRKLQEQSKNGRDN